MCNFFQQVKSDQKFISQPESSKYRMKRFRSHILIRIRFLKKTVFGHPYRLKTYCPTGYPTANRIVIVFDRNHYSNVVSGQ